MIIFPILAIIPTFLFWAWAHEFCHLLAHKVCGADGTYVIKVLPHKWRDKWYFARLHWVQYFIPPGGLTPTQRGFIEIAPRFVDLLAVIALPFAILFPGVLCWMWIVFWGGGIIDLIVGSIGWSERSDLRQGASWFEISPWILRTVGFTLAILSTATMIAWIV